jgi:hypothetical protein
MQTGDRLSYHPETAREEMAQRKQASARAIDSIQAMVTQFEAPDGHGNGTSGKSVSPKETPEQHAHHQLLLHRALIQAQDVETN